MKKREQTQTHQVKILSMNNRKGFGLLEIVFVVGLVAVLAGGAWFGRGLMQRQSAIETGNSALDQAQKLQNALNQQADDQANQIKALDALQAGGAKIASGTVDTSGLALSGVEGQSPELIEGRKTYRNEEYGFEIKYPPGWVESWSQNSEYNLASLNLKPDENSEESFSVSFGSYWEGGGGIVSENGETVVAGASRTRSTLTQCQRKGQCEYSTDIILCYTNCTELIPKAKNSSISLQHRCFGENTTVAKDTCIKIFDEIATTFKVIK